LLAPRGEKLDKSLAEHATLLEFQPPEGASLTQWIVHYGRTRLGVDVDPEAARLLQEAVGPELAQLAVELDKLASFSDGGRIDAAAVSAVVGVAPGESLGALLDAIAEKDAARAQRLIGPVLRSGRTTVVGVIMALATQFLALSWGAAMRARQQPTSALERGYYALLREAKAYPGRPWAEAVSLWVRVLPRWSVSELEQALRLLLAADVAAKEVRLSSEEQLLVTLILSLCQSSERRVA
jgi:DNA polymerase-3 subunit delta